MARQEKQIYLNNPNLPTATAEFEYNAKEVAEIKKCMVNILHFAENYFYIVSLDEGRQCIELHRCQKRVLRKMRDERFVILLASRQVGKTTLLTIYALWVACFQKDQSILIVANKEETAIEIFSRVRLAYEQLPNWIKPGIVSYGKTSLELSNGSKVGISTTTGSAARGKSINLLLLDELAFLEPGLVTEFWKSVYPIISSSTKSKIFISSTANGTGNLFHKIYSEAEAGKNGWAHDIIKWNEIPGRDDKWKDTTIATLGDYDAFRQEFNCEFLDSGESTINEELYSKLSSNIKEPKYVMDNGDYKIWDDPAENKIYVAGVDVAEGVDKDYSVINIFDITDLTNMKQVACYASNNISPTNFTHKLNDILTQWGKPLACIERNNAGTGVVDNLRNVYGYENVVSWGASEAGRARFQLGIISHSNTKYKGVANMRYWVNEVRSVDIRDQTLLHELKNFVRYSNGTWAAKKGAGYHDDRVMSLVWALIILEDTLVQKHFEVVQLDDNKRPLLIKALDSGFRYSVSPNSMYNERDDINSGMPTVMSIGDQSPTDENIDWLKSQGWKTLQ